MLESFLSVNTFSCFLVDATGVLYNDVGPTPMIAETIARLQALGTVIVVTNNSSYSRHHIAKRLDSYGITIGESHIISSGDGLVHDLELRALVEGKRCFVFGNETSHPYVSAAGGICCDSVEESEVILLMSSLRDKQAYLQQEVTSFLKLHPDHPVICCNPDEYVVGPDDQLIPVMGYFAKQMERDTQRSFIWMGKPFYNFAEVVKHKLLNEFNISMDASVLFFDDNPENLTKFEHYLGLSGCLIKDTGLSKLSPWAEMSKPRFELSTLSFTM